MNDLIRGWDIFWAHGHAHGGVWIAILVPTAIAIWFAFWTPRGRRGGEDDTSMKPKPRAPLPGPDRGFRP